MRLKFKVKIRPFEAKASAASAGGWWFSPLGFTSCAGPKQKTIQQIKVKHYIHLSSTENLQKSCRVYENVTSPSDNSNSLASSATRDFHTNGDQQYKELHKKTTKTPSNKIV